MAGCAFGVFWCKLPPVDNKCPACGFVSPEGAGFCTLCGVPFIPGSRNSGVMQKPPSRVKGDSAAEMDRATLQKQLEDEAKVANRTQEELLADLARLVPPGNEEDDLDSVLSDYDGSGRTPVVKPVAKPVQPAKKEEGKK